MKKRILLVGDHPYAFTGNGNMMRSLLSQVDFNEFEITCFGVSTPSKYHFVISATPSNLPYQLIPFVPFNDEVYGGSQVLDLIYKFKYDAMVIVGLDIWRYGYIFKKLIELRNMYGTKLSGIFPYDLTQFRLDWSDWFNIFDIPCVYSEYGYDILRKAVPNLRYFRPPLADSDLYYPMSDDIRKSARKKILGGEENDDLFIFGFVGVNQIRKDIPRFLKAFGEIVSPENKQAFMYLHTNFTGIYNIPSLVQDYRIRTGTISASRQDSSPLPESEMAEVYNAIDCLVNCSLQEGLSWTILNAMLCGKPIIASKNTAHIELFEDQRFLVECTDLAYINTMTNFGQAHIETKACDVKALAKSMLEMADTPKNELVKIGLQNRITGANWLCGSSNINDLISDLVPEKKKGATKKHAVLFVQHSSAGDILMSTQCLKGVKEKHPDIPLHYMTQKMFMDIVTGNKYIDEIIEWDDRKMKEYDFVYNPHGEKILPGGWNNLDVTLHSMYPYFCKVEADDISIELSKPDFLDSDMFSNARPMCIVHTTGGQPKYRTYKHLDIVLKKFALFVVQIGSENDWPVRSADLDLRGKLTWRETAWVMSHADIAICVDSFPMHLAAALGINTVAIFGPAPSRVTQPKPQHGARVICLEPDKLAVCPITSNCWGQTGKVNCHTPCINTIHPVRVANAIKNLLGEEK